MNQQPLNFVTGATGFLGTYLLKQLLNRGHRVRAMKRHNSPMHLVSDIEERIEWVSGDILDVGFLEEAMTGVDYVYHAAAMVSFDPKDVDRMMKVNVHGTANVVNIALHLGIKKLVHVSSIAALGRMEHQRRVDENATWQTSKLNSNYAISKFSAECEVWRGMEEGLNAVIVNPSVILGAGYWSKGSCRLFKKVWDGLNYYPLGATGFVDVRDVARSMIELMESDIRDERFIVNAENIAFVDFLKMVAQGLDKPAPRKEAKPYIKEILWRVERFRSLLTGSRPLLTKETVRTSGHSFEYLNDKLKSAIGFEYLPFEQSVRETCGQMRDSLSKGEQFAVFPD